MKALIIICAVFAVCTIAMLFVYKNAMPYDDKWDEWEEEQNDGAHK